MTPKLVVIDTQSLFDWLLFRNPACTRWSSVLSDGSWQWIFTSPMRDEFMHVAGKGFGERWTVRPAELAAAWSAHGRAVAIPDELGADRRLRCSDPDDQKFIDLAIAAGAHTLVSRDKALLRLSRKALDRHGLLIRAPLAWRTEDDPPEIPLRSPAA